jgi:Methyltransferase domain
MKCKICTTQAKKVFSARVMNKYDVEYFRYDRCEYLFTEDPYWLDEAYKRAINISDTGVISRNQQFTIILSPIIYFLFNKNGNYVDYAGGYGLFTRMMRDVGFDFYWYDPHCENLFSSGFEINIKNENHFEVISAFEVFEHLINPADEIKKMLQLSKTIIFSTEILPIPVPKPDDWWYYAFEHGQHISFYSLKTLNFLAKKFGLNLYTCADLYIMTKGSLNTTKLKLITKMYKYGLFIYVKHRMQSKIWGDHLSLKKREGI